MSDQEASVFGFRTVDGVNRVEIAFGAGLVLVEAGETFTTDDEQLAAALSAHRLLERVDVPRKARSKKGDEQPEQEPQEAGDQTTPTSEGDA